MDVSIDESLMKAVERRRAAEAERRKRIFSARNRVIGLDAHALEQQVAERHAQEDAERQQKMNYDALCLSMDQKLMEQQREEEERRRELAQELVEYWEMNQRPEDSRDADINYKHKGGSSVTLVDPNSLGPASMQVFQGEGIGEDERKKLQMEQNVRTLRAQREAQEKFQMEQKHKELLRDQNLIQRDMTARHLDVLEEESKKAALIALKSYNQAQAEERLERERQDKERQEGLNLAEVLNMVTSDFLTECADAAVKEGMGSAEDPQTLSDHWKGMSSEQRSAIYRHRAKQCAENERQRQREKQDNLTWGWQELEHDRQLVEEDRRMMALERERRAQLDRYNQQLAREQQAQQQYLNTELYTNRPTRCYFSQFNTSSR
ncbi:RIB43A-like with coiled-coils protein 1 [Tachysurus vachellii]|uniref:RIB43A-like with coiled-coils protein 1 n=1 Tax=Tachysurus vachellii TaxID=175792 RepID=UPI00296AFAEA|nr:RIB43A-like with coiled-coils protein 1 [Tachysurus vachellii]